MDILGRTLDHYEIIEPLGAGGMGEVYRARDTTLDRDVAIKVLPADFAADPDRLARFEREAKLLASLNHANIATIHGFQESDGVRFIAMECVHGQTLAERLGAEGRLEVEESCRIALQVAEALEAAHESGIVHRDLKPANVKVTPEGQVKVLDFGLAKAFDSAPEADPAHSPTLTARATQAGVIMGTAAYMSPEQARGKSVDRRTDIWALGCLLYEMLCGVRAFRGEDVSLTLAEVMKGEPDWSRLPDEVPGPVRMLLARCLEKDLRRRLRDIGEARIVMEDVLAGRGAEAVESQETSPRRPMGWMALAATLALALVIALVSRDSTIPEPAAYRFSVPLPESGLTFNHAVSPDGRYVAFQAVVAAADELNTAVFVRALDSWDLQLLTGSIGASNLFWSPDSRSIAFFANEKLKKVDVNGGPAEDLSDVPGLLGSAGTWGRSGAIIFSSSYKYAPGPLYRVSAGGGDAQPLTTAGPGESHESPTFLPDGEHFVYTRFGGSAPGIYLASLDDPGGRRLLADQASARFAPAPPDGGAADLLFIRDGNVMAHPFDSERLELTGQPFVVLDRAPYGDSGSAAVSVSHTGTLTYTGGTNRESDSRFTWLDRSGALLSDIGRGTDAAMPVALSPDEATLVLYRRAPGRWDADLYLLDLARGGSGTRFTDLGSVDNAGNVLWAPDGEAIVFSARSSDQFDLFWKATRSAGAAQVLLESAHPKYPTDWSRDGRYILYTELNPSTQADVWYLPVDKDSVSGGLRAGEPVAFLQSEYLESAAQLSPDGQWIAYASNRTGLREIYVQPFPAGGTPYKVSEGGAAQPRWSADGRELFFVTRSGADHVLWGAAVRTLQPSSPGGRPGFAAETAERLFQTQMNSFHPATGAFFYAVSRDGQRFLVNRLDGPGEPLLNVVVNWRRAFGVAEDSR
jgi:Tol biopolymer transport system component